MKNKGNNFFRLAVISFLSIGLFSAAFIGVNSLAFAAVTNKPEIIPPVVSVTPLSSSAGVLLEDYKKSELTVYERPMDKFVKSGNEISSKEAAEIGAQYIWEVLGEEIDGKMVIVNFEAWPSCTRTYWHGAVVDSKWCSEFLDADKDSLRFKFVEATSEATLRFTIDAVTGERISIARDNWWVPRADGEDWWRGKTAEEQLDYQQTAVKYDNEYRNRHDEQSEIATAYAQKHFSSSKVVSAAFVAAGLEYDEKVIIFKVTDDTGREAQVAFLIDTRQLLYIQTQANDIMPGYTTDSADRSQSY